MSKTELETWKHGTDWQLSEGGGGQWWKEGEGIGQRTCMNGPWTWTTVRGLNVGAGVGLGGGGQKGKVQTNVME